MEPTLLQRAFELLANKPIMSDREGVGGVHPNDYRAAVDEWIREYAAHEAARELQEADDAEG